MKGFFKQVSIYGILPVIGKFAGFFLIPIYARVFSATEFGVLELFMTLVKFLLFGCNLEFYSSIGRFFYERESNEKRSVLISTGLFLTIITSFIVSLSVLMFEDGILRTYLKGYDFLFEFRLCFAWLFIEAIAVYLSVIPRYDKKPKSFVILSVSSLLIRIFSTIILVLIFDKGIIGVIYGHIIGSIISLIGYGFSSKKYLTITFSFSEAWEIVKFALPIVPGILLIGLWGPVSRSIIADSFSLITLGLFAFAFRVSAIIEIINGAIHMAWNPMLFENYKNASFNKDVQEISGKVGFLALMGVSVLTILSPEIAQIIGTDKFKESALLIGFLSLSGVLDTLIRLRGFGPLILNKTFILTLVEIFKIIIALLLIINFNDYGLLSIGLAFLVPSLLKYLFLTYYTSINLKLKFIHFNEIILFLLLLISLIFIFLDIDLFYRLILILIILISQFRMVGKYFQFFSKLF